MIGTNTNLANAIGTTDRLARQTVSAVAARVLPTSRHSPRKAPHPIAPLAHEGVEPASRFSAAVLERFGDDRTAMLEWASSAKPGVVRIRPRRLPTKRSTATQLSLQPQESNVCHDAQLERQEPASQIRRAKWRVRPLSDIRCLRFVAAKPPLARPLGAANLAGNPAKKCRPGRANAMLEARQGRLRHKHGSALGLALGLSVQAAVQVSQRRADRLAASAGSGMVTP